MLPINIIISKKPQGSHTDYMQYYRSDMINVFVGERNTGKSSSIDRFLGNTEARKDFKIYEYEHVSMNDVIVTVHQAGKSAITNIRRPELCWYKKGDVLTVNPKSEEMAKSVLGLINDIRVKYTIFIH